jgi:hypothetical protein
MVIETFNGKCGNIVLAEELNLCLQIWVHCKELASKKHFLSKGT